jgi:hypothetical protein
MSCDFTALVIDRKAEKAEELRKVLEPEFQFTSVEHTNSLLKAVQSHEEAEYKICLISETFPIDDLRIFFSDIKHLHRDLSCVFVVVKENLSEGPDEKSLQDIGVNLVISNKGTPKDKQALDNVVCDFFEKEELKKKVFNVNDTMDLLLNEIDKVAESKKRSRKKEIDFDKLAADFINHQTEFDPKVLEKYYETLTVKSGEAEASIANSLEIPEEVLAKQLPGLENDTYTGISHRVWKKLQKKHGSKKKRAKS